MTVATVGMSSKSERRERRGRLTAATLAQTPEVWGSDQQAGSLQDTQGSPPNGYIAGVT